MQDSTIVFRNSNVLEKLEDSQLDSKTLKINAIRDPNNGGDSVPNVTFWFPDSGADVDKDVTEDFSGCFTSYVNVFGN